jgi:PAS domain S-box-containing protein
MVTTVAEDAIAPVSSLNRQVLEQIAIASAEGILVIEAGAPDSPVAYVNPAYERLSGYEATELVGRSWRMLEPSADDSEELTVLRSALGRGEACSVTLPDLRKDGATWMSRIRVQPIVNRRGELKQFLVFQAETAEAADRQSGPQLGLLQRELRRARQKVANLDRIDPASGVLRYEYFLDLATRDCRNARRERANVAVALFEINDLDAYRETFGVKAADSCVRMIAAQVTGALRRSGDLCACDDDKRLIAFTQGQDADDLGELAERVAANVRRLGLHNPRGRTGRYITVRAGVAACTPTGNDALGTLVEEARAQLDEPAELRRSARA